MKIAVLGSGGWGTALAMLLAENGHTVTLWSYLEEESRRLQQTRENPLLPGVTLPESLSYTWDLSCVRGCGVVVMATPSFGVRSTAEGIRGMLTPETILVSVSKGIEKGSSLRMTEIIRQATGDLCPVVALSGPSHAEEVARRVPTAVVSACPDQAAAETVQDLFLNDRFRVYSSSDVVGVELGAALKNVMALCTGCCTGMGYGDNTKAMLMTRGLAGDLCRPGGDGGPDRHLHLHELPKLPGRHPHRPGHARPAGHPGDRRRGGGLLRRGLRPGAGQAGGGGDAHHPGRLPGAL